MDKDTLSYTLENEPALFADRGFTGHEYLEDFKLYNMNGRLYDPVLGRFLSPDPFVQMPDFSQNFNRYSYCLNNPLKFTDPDGELFFEIAAFLVFTYLKTAYDNRDEQSGKWAWNPVSWFKKDDFRIQVGVNTNTNFSDVTVFGGAGFGDALPAFSNNSNHGFGFGSVYRDGSNCFYYPSYKYFSPEQKVNQAIVNAQTSVSNLNDFEAVNYILSANGTRYGIEPYTGPRVISGAPSFIGGPLRKGQQAIKLGKYLFSPSTFHTTKQVLLKSLGTKGYASVVGNNPDIMFKGTKVFLTGAKNSPYFGKSYETGLSVLDFIDLFY